MASLNKVMLIGNLGGDPETRYLPDGTNVTNFSLATNRQWKDKSSGEKKQHTEWHRCVAFGRTGEVIAEYACKGHRLYVEGDIRYRSWEDNEGTKRYSTDIHVFQCQLLERKPGGQRPPPIGDKEPPAQATEAGTDEMEDFDDDIPF